MVISDEFEQRYWNNGKLVFGVDEAGMGCLSGSMFVGGVVFPLNYDFSKKLSGVNDSKKLSMKRRITLEPMILDDALFSFCAKISPKRVDEESAYHARFTEASKRITAFYKENVAEFCTLMDGNVAIALPECPSIESFYMIKGDAKSYTLAAASILAKCAKDREMIELDKEFPNYLWAKNKGYGTKAHSLAIKKHGLTKYHRLTYCKKFKE